MRDNRFRDEAIASAAIDPSGEPNGDNLRGARFRWNSLNGMDVGRELSRFEGLINGKLPLSLLQMARVDLALGHRVRTD